MSRPYNQAAHASIEHKDDIGTVTEKAMSYGRILHKEMANLRAPESSALISIPQEGSRMRPTYQGPKNLLRALPAL